MFLLMNCIQRSSEFSGMIAFKSNPRPHYAIQHLVSWFWCSFKITFFRNDILSEPIVFTQLKNLTTKLRLYFTITYSNLLGLSSFRRAMSTSGVVEATIRNKLQTTLEANHLDIINESYMHNVPKGAETHFKVVVVSNKFDGLPLIKVSIYLNL